MQHEQTTQAVGSAADSYQTLEHETLSLLLLLPRSDSNTYLQENGIGAPKRGALSTLRLHQETCLSTQQ